MNNSPPKYEDTQPLHQEGNGPRYEDTHPIENNDSSGLSDTILNGLQAVNSAVTDPLGLGKFISGEKPTNFVEDQQRAMQQGGTLGFSDEIRGALGAVKGLVTGDDIQNSYVDARDKEREAIKAAKENSPIMYGGTEFTSGMGVPGLGLGGKVWKATKSMPLLARLAARMGAGGVEMGTMGAASGAGYSEGTSPEDVAQDALHGGKIGGAVGTILPGALTHAEAIKDWAVPKIGQGIKSLPFEATQNITNAYEKGTEGTILNKSKHLGELGDLARSTNEYVTGLYSDLKNQYTDLLKEFDASGGKIDLADKAREIEEKAQEILANTKDDQIIADVNAVRQKIGNYVKFPSTQTVTENVPIPQNDTSGGLLPPPEPQFQQVQREVQVPGETTVNGSQAKEIQTTLGDMANADRSQLDTTPGRMFAGNAKQTLNQEINNVPQLKDVNAKYAAINDAFDQLGLRPDEVKLDPTGRINPDVTGKLVRIMEGAEKQGSGQIKISDQLSNAIESLRKVDPAKANALEAKVREISENLVLSKQVGGEGFMRFISPVKALGSIANITGYAQSKVSPVISSAMPGIVERFGGAGVMEASKPNEVSKDAYQLGNQELSNLSTQLMSNPTLQTDGAALQKAISTNNSVSKNAIIFNLLQKKEGRDVLRSMAK